MKPCDGLPCWFSLADKQGTSWLAAMILNIWLVWKIHVDKIPDFLRISFTDSGKLNDADIIEKMMAPSLLPKISVRALG